MWLKRPRRSATPRSSGRPVAISINHTWQGVKYALPPRLQWIMGLFLVIMLLLLGRAIDLQWIKADFLQSQGEARYLRTLPIVAHRGMLLDRQGEPLAMSTPVDSVWINPAQFMTARPQWGSVAELLALSFSDLDTLLAGRMHREFVYLKRHISPSLSQRIKALNIPGVFLQREYRRYYPTAEVCSHVLGFTNIDDRGQEGLELAFDEALRGRPGEQHVIQDNRGQVIAQVAQLRLPRRGQDIRLSLDRRLQYLAYRALKAAVHHLHAQSAAAVILAIPSGEVLAMVNQPGYNPNDRQQLAGEVYRNRAVTDVFEPGSTLKPFTVITALESQQYTPHTLVDTRPGQVQMGQYTIRDSRNYGVIDVATVIQKSSNVGASRIALSLSPQQLWQQLTRLGLGQVSGSGFPGEASGYLAPFTQWQPVEQASLSFGYGMNLTLLQLARAYAAIGNQGQLPPVHFMATTGNSVAPQVMSAQTAQQMLTMLEKVTQLGGTGAQARIPGFKIAGKTGTVHKSTTHGYSNHDYIAVFVGLVPATAPRLVMAVMINEPQEQHYGGEVAAPVFAQVMSGALRILNIPPDEPHHYRTP